MGLASTAYIRSCPLTEEEAETIRKKLHLFGYAPRKLHLSDKYHLIMHSERDCEIVRILRNQGRRK